MRSIEDAIYSDPSDLLMLMCSWTLLIILLHVQVEFAALAFSYQLPLVVSMFCRVWCTIDCHMVRELLYSRVLL